MSAQTIGTDISSEAQVAATNGYNAGKKTVSALTSYVFTQLFAKYGSSVPVTTLHQESEDAAVGATTSTNVPFTIGGVQVADPSLSTAQSAISAVQTPLSDAAAVTNFLGELNDPTTYLRAVYIVGGGILILSGLFIIAKELGANVPAPPVVTLAKAVNPIGGIK